MRKKALPVPRAVNLDSANKDSTGLGLSVNDKVIPEVDVSYFFTPNTAAELVFIAPAHDLSSSVLGGKIRYAQAPCLAFAGGAVPLQRYRLQVPMWASSLHPLLQREAAAGVDIDHNSFGAALQVGVDILCKRTCT